jgi:hypothetical protein
MSITSRTNTILRPPTTASRGDLSTAIITRLEYLSYQTQAEQYIKGQKYSDALVLLNKISKDYPTYSKITADITAASQHLANIPAEKVASAKAAVAKTAPQSGPENAQSAPKSTDCSTPAPIVGKRYANTDAFNALTSAGSVDQIEQQLQNFFNQYGLNVEIKNVSANSQFLSTNSVSYDSVTDSDTCSLRNLAMLLVDEWSKYPADWVRSSNLQTIVLIKNMNRVFGGSSYPVSATYDVYDSQMWYDVAYTGDYMREAIHHEYYHLLVYHYSQTSSHDDNAWLSDNPAGFAYGGGGASCYAPGNNCLSGEHPAPSFVTGYSASAMAEDQAETYAYLMTDTYYHHLKNWLQSDPLLAAKIKSQQQFIAARSSTMDTGYFDSINP